MPEGPFGGPRITELLPFSSDEVVVEFEEDRVSGGHPPIELRKLFSRMDIQPQSWVKVDRRVVVRQNPGPSAFGVLDKVKDEISELGERAASITYFIIPEEELGYIASVRVDRRFRRRGLASEIREGALDDMRQLGAETIYTFPASRAGRKLAESQGFTESEFRKFLSKDI